MSVTSALQDHHHHCDEDFASAEDAAQRGDWPACATAFAKLHEDMQSHFHIEEDVLFAAFEAQTGMTGGPTQVMRHEHKQMLGLLQQLDTAQQNKDADQFGGVAETLLVLMQQHNMKEENILYPMCDQALGGNQEVAAQIQQGLHA